MAIYSGARYRPIKWAEQRDDSTDATVVILHLTASEAGSQYSYFLNSRKACSHFHVARDGSVEQYIDTSKLSAADGQGSDDAISIETQGADANGVWGAAQLEALAHLLAWISKTHGIPLSMISSSRVGERGIGWHRLGIDGNFPALPSILAGRSQRGGGESWSSSRGKVCPGDNRILQVPALIERARVLSGDGVSVPVVSGAKKVRLKAGATLSGLAAALGITLVALLGVNPQVNEPSRVEVGQVITVPESVTTDQLDDYAKAEPVSPGASAPAPAPAPTPPASSGPVVSKVPHRGSSGPAIAKIQRQLKAHGYKIAADGIFGSATHRAVINFQGLALLNQDGYVGAKTNAALAKPVVRYGSKGSSVVALQKSLRAHGYKIAADGIFGSATNNAVKNFQGKKGLYRDGIVGVRTWARL